MKLRLRSLETKETLKIELPTPCSLEHLKGVVSRRVSSSSLVPASVHLSLNRNDELLGSSPQDSLQSLGITSGDLIFFTFNPYGFSSETLIIQSNSSPQEPTSTQHRNSREALTIEPNSQKESTLDQTLVLNAQKEETLNFESVKTETRELNTRKEETEDSDSIKSETKPREDQILGLDTQIGETPNMSGTENMDIDDDRPMVEAGKSFSVPRFLRKVFRKEVGEDGGGDHKLLVIAVHAVLLESGFVGFNLVSRMKVEGFYLPDEWPSSAFTMSLCYTLPGIIQTVNGIETVLLRFQSLGKFVNVYGSLAKNGSGTYRVCLDEDRWVFFLNIMWANCDSINHGNEISDFPHLYPDREIFEFWKTIKDRLALPLLIDLCEKAGLAPPPCFMRLPTDLKLRILESLPGIDVARVGCVCSELRYLSSSDDIWKQKFVEQFGNGEGLQGGGSHWKEKFAKSWETRKRRRMATSERLPRLIGEPSLWVPRIIRDPDPLRVPRIIGGNYAGGPGFPLGRTVHAAARRNVLPHCNLGLRRA